MFDHYNTFYAETPLEHRSEQIINVIGNFVVTRLNEDFGKTSGIDDFFELSGNDKHEFWFHYSDSAEACLRELAKKRLEVFNSMSNQTLRSIFIEKGLRLAKKPRITAKLAHDQIESMEALSRANQLNHPSKRTHSFCF